MLTTALLLLVVANGAPVLAWYLLRRRFEWPLDGGRVDAGGKPWLGKSKTFRGILFSLLATATVTGLLDLGWLLGAGFALLAMVGDLLTSFCKRRLGLSPSSRAPGFDQLLESLLPLLGCARYLQLTGLEVLLLVVAFWLVDVSLSRLLYALHMRKRPY